MSLAWHRNDVLAERRSGERRLAKAVAAAEKRGWERAIEAAARRAARCWHGPGDHGCEHGSAIAHDIRDLPYEPPTEKP